MTFLPDNLKNTLDYRSKKSKKCPELQSQFEENWLFGNFSLQIAPIVERFSRVEDYNNFKNTLDFRAKKSIKWPVLQEQFEEKYKRDLRKNWLFGHLLCKNTIDYRAKSQNSTRYYRRIFRKSLTPRPPKSICSSKCASNIEHFFVFFAR